MENLKNELERRTKLKFVIKEDEDGKYLFTERPYVIKIRGTESRLGVGGIGLFPLFGERHTVETFINKLPKFCLTLGNK